MPIILDILQAVTWALLLVGGGLVIAGAAFDRPVERGGDQ
jgi:hypothetical protein